MDNPPANNNAQNAANPKGNPGGESQSPNRTTVNLAIESESGKPKSKRKCHKAPQYIEAGCAIALVLITTFYTYYASEQADAAIKAANAAAAANKIAGDAAKSVAESQRAYISIVSAPEAYQNGRTGVQLFSSGPSPAFNVRHGIDWTVHKVPLKLADRFNDPAYESDIEPYTMQNPENEPLTIDIQPTAAQQLQLDNGYGVILWGTIEYQSLGKTHHSRFCYLLPKDVKAGASKRCPNHNDSD